MNDEILEIGNFYPNVTEAMNYGGYLDLNLSKIVWLTQHIPNDGSEPPNKCVLSGFSELLDVSCEGAIIITNVIGFGLFGILLVISFIVVKRR